MKLSKLDIEFIRKAHPAKEGGRPETSILTLLYGREQEIEWAKIAYPEDWIASQIVEYKPMIDELGMADYSVGSILRFFEGRELVRDFHFLKQIEDFVDRLATEQSRRESDHHYLHGIRNMIEYIRLNATRIEAECENGRF